MKGQPSTTTDKFKEQVTLPFDFNEAKKRRFLRNKMGGYRILGGVGPGTAWLFRWAMCGRSVCVSRHRVAPRPEVWQGGCWSGGDFAGKLLKGREKKNVAAV